MPYAVATSISGMAIVAIILMLVTSKGQTNGTAFTVGYALRVRARGDDRVALAGGKDYSSRSRPNQTVSIIKLLLVLLLLLLPVAAVRQRRGRPKEGEKPKMPKWMGTIDSFTAVRYRRAAIGGEPEEPGDVNIAGLAIAQAGIPTGQEAVVMIIYIVIGASTMLAPVLVYFTMGDRAATILCGWRTWLEENNAVVGAVVLLILGAVLIGQGITGLS